MILFVILRCHGNWLCLVCFGVAWTRPRRGFSPQIEHILKTLVLHTHTHTHESGAEACADVRVTRFLWLI